MSRLLAETTGGRNVTYAYDDAGNRTGLRYPSNRVLGSTFDSLSRPSVLGIVAQMPTGGQAPQSLDHLASFSYRGTSLIAGKTIGTGPQPAVRATTAYDPARRLISSVVRDVTTRPVIDEALAWTPRSFLQTLDRRERNGDRLTLAYDPAGRVTTASRSGESRPAIPEVFGFEYDEADNLLARTEETPFGTAEIELPLDGSGRNRPASVGGVPLEWDANGNLKKKGDLTFHYDAKSRLTRVTGPQGEVARYEYDAFNRRIAKTVGGVTRETVWSGTQPLEDYVGGSLRERRTYGLGLDEIVWSERDTDGDGTPDASYHPLYDATGNLAMVVDEDGKPIEQYEYSPFGERWVVVNDRAPPAVEQARVVGAELWLELSEEVALWKLEAARSAGELALTATAGNTSLAFTLSQPVAEGPLAGRRVKLALTSPPSAGAEVRLVAPAGAFEDLFGNGTAAAFDQTFTWTEGVRSDTTAPTVEMVSLDAGKPRVTFSEPVDAATAATAILVDGQATTWTVAADGYSLVGASSLAPGAHTIAIGTGVADLAGTALAEALGRSFTTTLGQEGQLVWLAPDPTLSTASTVDNLFGFHGLPIDPETGLIYVRNRYYDPELGRFITTDPLGYVDGPNPYQYALNNPYAYSDPLGLSSQGWEDFKKFGRGFRKGLWRGLKNFVTGTYDMVTNPRETLDNLVTAAENPEQALQGMLMSGWDFIGKLASPDPEVVGDAIGGAVGEAAAGKGVGKALGMADELGGAVKTGRRMNHVPDPPVRSHPVHLDSTSRPRTLQKPEVNPGATSKLGPSKRSVEDYLGEAQRRVQEAKRKYGGEGIVAMDKNAGHNLMPGDRLDDLEIVVVGSGATPKSFRLREGIDDKPLAGVTEPGKSASIATDLTRETEIPKMFGGRDVTREDVISGAFVEDIRAAGYDVVYAPTDPNPDHVRIIAGERTFNDEDLEWLALAFDKLKKNRKKK